MIPRTAITLLALAGLMLAACGSDDDAPAADDTLPGAGAAPTTADMDGQTFESTDVTGHDLVADSSIDLDFRDDRLSANAGCNTMSSGYSITAEGTLEVDAMAATMIACADELMAQDTWLSEFLTSGPQIALDGTDLTLTGADATIVLAAVQPAPLEGTTWTITSTVANEAVSSIPLDAEPSLTITDGQAAVDTGCNRGSGAVEVADATLTFGPLATTKMACSPELNELEATVLAVLQGEVSYEIDGNSLSLRSGDGADEIGLELTATP